MLNCLKHKGENNELLASIRQIERYLEKDGLVDVTKTLQSLKSHC